LSKSIKDPRIRSNGTPEMSWLEGIFSRGDRRLTTVLVKACKRGEIDAWSEHFRLDLWQEAFHGAGWTPHFTS